MSVLRGGNDLVRNLSRSFLDPMQIEVKYLADHPELIHLMATWFIDEWGKNNPSLTVANIEHRIRERMNRDKLPLCLLAFVESQPVGTATLKIREMEIYPQFEHWLGNVYVLPEYRNQGVGSYVVGNAAEKAKLLGIRDLYLYTRNREHLYQRIGWKLIEQVDYRGRRASIMKREFN